jgi:hypothetical protein
MSGGYFDYNQYRIDYIADAIEELIASNDDQSTDEWGDPVGRMFSDQTIAELETALKYLRLAKIYTHRIDWMVSGDDCEDSFNKRLKEDLYRFESNRNSD